MKILATSEGRVSAVGVVLIAVGGALGVASGDEPVSRVVQGIGVACIGVGASLLATAVASRLVANQVFGLDIRAAIEALRGTSPFSRSDQTVQIDLERTGNRIKVEATHEFTLHIAGQRTRDALFTIFTDVGSWSEDGGFLSITGPGMSYDAADLKERTRHSGGKVELAERVRCTPGVPMRFRIVTVGSFRCVDRLIWTIENISSDLLLTIHDRTPEGRAAAAGGTPSPVAVKINHHNAQQMVPRKEKSTTDITVYDFLGDVLPFQGFEVLWHFQDSPSV